MLSLAHFIISSPLHHLWGKLALKPEQCWGVSQQVVEFEVVLIHSRSTEERKSVAEGLFHPVETQLYPLAALQQHLCCSVQHYSLSSSAHQQHPWAVSRSVWKEALQSKDDLCFIHASWYRACFCAWLSLFYNSNDWEKKNSLYLFLVGLNPFWVEIPKSTGQTLGKCKL